MIGLALNHEGMTDAEVAAAIVRYERTLGVPTTDPLGRPPERLAEMVLQAVPRLVGPAGAAAPT